MLHTGLKTLDCVKTYASLFSGSLTSDITPERFVESLNLYVFEVSKVKKGTRNIQRGGLTWLSIDFSQPLPAPMTLILYGRFPASFRVDASCSIRMS